MTIVELQDLHDQVFASWVRELGLEVRATTPDSVTLALPVHARHVQAGGVMCGQALMAAADTALVLAISHQLGGFRPQTTVQLQTSFLRPVGKEVAELGVEARILKSGRSLVFGEVTLRLPDGQVAAHATSTSALL